MHTRSNMVCAKTLNYILVEHNNNNDDEMDFILCGKSRSLWLNWNWWLKSLRIYAVINGTCWFLWTQLCVNVPLTVVDLWTMFLFQHFTGEISSQWCVCPSGMFQCISTCSTSAHMYANMEMAFASDTRVYPLRKFIMSRMIGSFVFTETEQNHCKDPHVS